VVTHGTGGFARLELVFDAFSRVMLSAYAGPGAPRNGVALRASKVPARTSPKAVAKSRAGVSKPASKEN
jgi:hypothetical protein